MNEIELSAGSVEYTVTGGAGPVLVVLHGLMMDATLWDEVIADLWVDYRCVAPTLPLGAHRRPMPQGRLVDIPRSFTLVPLDQPGELAAAIREFVPASAAAWRPVQ